MRTTAPLTQQNAAAGLAQRDAALEYLKQKRAALVRKAQREAVRLVLLRLTVSSDDLHVLHTGPEHRQYLGAALNGLAKSGVIQSVGRVTTKIKSSHGRKVELWGLKDEAVAVAWLAAHPEITPPPPTQKSFSFGSEA